MTLLPLCDLRAFLVLLQFSLLINPSPSLAVALMLLTMLWSCPNSVTKEAVKVGFTHCEGDCKASGERSWLNGGALKSLWGLQ